MKMILGLLVLVTSLMLFGCTALDDATTDLENKAKTNLDNETEVEEPTEEPTEPALECEEKYWFDEDSTECEYKEFCGMYMYQGLRTFETEDACEAALTEFLNTEVSTDCLDMDEDEKWDCLVNKAESDQNMAICNQITLKDKRNTCIKTVAHILHDLDECEKLTDNDDQLICRVYSGPQTTGGMT